MLTNKTKVSYKLPGGTNFIEIKGVQEIPELTQEKEKIETTDLMSNVKTYENGIGDSPEVFDEASANDDVLQFKMEYPNGALVLEFPAQCSVNLGGGSYNTLITYTLNLTLTGEITKTYV